MTEEREIVAGRGFLYTPMPFVMMKVAVETHYDSDRMQKAIYALENVHPTINDVVKQNDGKLFFCEAGKHVPVIEFTAEDKKNWREVVCAAAKYNVNVFEEPGVMVYVVDNGNWFHLIVACHHMYGDGLSVRKLVDDLLYIYRTGRPLKTREPKADLSEKDLPVGCEIPDEYKEKLNHAVELWKDKSMEFNADTYRNLNETVVKLSGFGFDRDVIRGREFVDLQDKAKENNVTMTSVLTAAMTKTLQGDTGIDSVVAVNCRELLGFDNDKSVSNFSSCVNPRLRYDADLGFWENVKQINQMLKEIRDDKAQLLETLHSFMVLDENIFGAAYHARCGAYRDIDMLMAIKDALGTIDNAFDISNIGKVDFSSRDEFRIRDCYFIPNLATTCNYAFGVMAIDGALSISMSYKASAIPEQKARDILADIIKTLNEA